MFYKVPYNYEILLLVEHVFVYIHLWVARNFLYMCINSHIHIYVFWWRGGASISFHQHLKGSHHLKLIKNLWASWCSASTVIRNMQLKTTRRYHYTPSRMAIIKKTSNTEYWWGCGKSGTFIHCWWKCKMVQPLWKTVWQFLTKLDLPYGPAISLLVIYQREWKHMSTQRPVHKFS